MSNSVVLGYMLFYSFGLLLSAGASSLCCCRKRSTVVPKLKSFSEMKVQYCGTEMTHVPYDSEDTVEEEIKECEEDQSLVDSNLEDNNEDAEDKVETDLASEVAAESADAAEAEATQAADADEAADASEAAEADACAAAAEASEAAAEASSDVKEKVETFLEHCKDAPKIESMESMSEGSLEKETQKAQVLQDQEFDGAWQYYNKN